MRRFRRETGGLCLCGELRVGLCEACEAAVRDELEFDEAEFWPAGVPEPQKRDDYEYWDDDDDDLPF